ncbi:ABC transporter permease [Propionivibrio soli]|jgi:peptide/nickel transport system permease protein|uniref:ABC transporter permease n=1 Tax=Propionivibrio soli TaxID=2976531 RepID=UPI0021E98B84|nr:ABC transporter permease [Propionivibrio soli]
MTTYILRRLLVSIPILLGITVIVFFVASKMPGDAVLAMISTETPQAEDLIKLRRGQLGLDLPLYVQYGRWLWQLLQGNLGYSFQTGESVIDILLARIPATLQLMGTALLIAIVLGVAMGVVSALKQYSRTDYTFTFLGFAGISIPDFFLGMVLVYLLAIQWPLFPTSGISTAGEPYSLVDNLRHLALPALALGLVRTATFMRYTRTSVLEVMNNDYVRTARAKGLSEWLVVVRHILRNALIPVVTVIGLTLPVLFGGSVIIEMIFQWPGIGLMFIGAVTARDSPVIMGYVLFSAVMVQASNLLTDMAYSFLDPRIRYD